MNKTLFPELVADHVQAIVLEARKYAHAGDTLPETLLRDAINAAVHSFTVAADRKHILESVYAVIDGKVGA